MINYMAKKSVIFTRLIYAGITLVSMAAVCYLTVFLYLRFKYPEPTNQGRNIIQWLQILRADANAVDSPLNIISISNNGAAGFVAVEVPLLYNLLEKNGFLAGNGKLGFVVNDKNISTYSERALNGNCKMKSELNNFVLGTNRLQVEIVISNPLNTDRPLHAIGPIAELVITNK
jgi:hypothetical protein